MIQEIYKRIKEKIRWQQHYDETPPAHRTGAGTMNPGGRRQSRWTPDEDHILIRELVIYQQTSPTGLQLALPHRTPYLLLIGP
jgi:hypothetical protein